MKSIHVRLDEAEHARLASRAREEGRSLQDLAHEALVNETAVREHIERVARVVARVHRLSKPLLDDLEEYDRRGSKS
jgi:hypothetical protein